MHESAYVVAADQRDVVPELALVKFEQSAAVSGLLFAHAVKHVGRRRKGVAQAFGVVGVNALVFFLQRDRQGKYFALRKAIKATHDR